MTDIFITALMITGVGMVGIFIFMSLFWVIITTLHKKFPGEEKKTTPEEAYKN